ncbi:hypothetical protein NBH20_23600 [Rhizobium sp. S153]|uniref:Reverse transcriptase n=1 Tax=Ciceribacter sichuanensis TaxID=2949647 RepID=A0ABT0VI89_9HYPH|nr:hypothetical protein [Ciceribacter sp. S153]MCM2404170.1 hypothetical protein [Ciceribacter sp. S153]
MPVGVVASTHFPVWKPREKDVKRYFHFDRYVSPVLAEKLANDPHYVATHSFFPLIRFHESWTKYRKVGKPRKKKVRPLRYAAHLDAIIFAKYRADLASLYENELARRNLADVPVAYRQILDEHGKAKSNIEIARDVFSVVRKLKDCVVTVVDIKSYFESLDHANIEKQWSNLIGGTLPADHQSVFKAVTKYSVVDLDKVEQRLSLLGTDINGVNRKSRRLRKIDVLRREGKKQLCTPQEFRSLIAGGDPAQPSLIQKNGFPFGIPQGTPISDLIANFYLIDFDEIMSQWAQALGGIYRRYSDDIVVVLPRTSVFSPDEPKLRLQTEIRKHGSKLEIQEKKVCVGEFVTNGLGIEWRHISGTSSRNGLEYLGFEFDGMRVKIRNSTLSNAWRKMKRQAHGHAFAFVRHYRDKGLSWIRANYPHASLERSILQDVTFHQDTGYDTWTFVKYARRASHCFVGFHPIFSKQTRRYRYFTKIMIAAALEEAITKVKPRSP